MNYFRFRDFGEQCLESLAQQFAAAEPFPHIVIPDFISLPPDEVLPALPPPDHSSWRRHTDAYEAGKMSFNDIEHMAEPLPSMLRELSSPAFLQFLQRLTGITDLLTDPYLSGAGLHASGPGGLCSPHTDNHINERLHIFRRVNLLVYLNPGWEEEFGGCLELYALKPRLRLARTIVPRWGTCVIFQSDGSSVHGFSQAIAVERPRLSLAVYYYTSLDATRFSGAPLTLWRHHDKYWGLTGTGLIVRLGRMYLYRSLRFGSKALAYLAHQVRPRPVHGNGHDAHR